MNKREVLIFCIFIIGIISFYFDNFIVKQVSLIRNFYLNQFFLGMTFLSSAVIIFFILTSLFLFQERKRKWIFPLWFTLGISVLINILLKNIFQRTRPFQQEIVAIGGNLIETGFSFPSSHAVIVFSALPILSKEFPRFKYFWIVLASLVGFSRVYFGVHFLSDVIFGGLIGYIIGFGILKLEEKNGFGEKVYRMIFGK